jgi:ribonuclease E
MKDALKNDRARIQVGHISHFGLLEMSRQRLRPGLLEGSSRTCPHCEGRGIVRSVSSCGLSVLRAIEEHLIARKPENLTVKCTREIAFYILNEKRDNLLEIETTYGISVFIVPSDELKGSQALIERAPERNLPPRKVVAAPVRMDSAHEEDTDDDIIDCEVTEIEAEAEADDDAEDGSDAAGDERRETGNGNGEQREGGKRRRRRRGRRGGRGRDDLQAEGQHAESDDDIPGLGEQPDIGVTGDDDGQSAEAASDGDDASPGQREDAQRSRRPRRDRWGRNRDRNRSENGDPRRPRAGETEAEVEADMAFAASEADLPVPHAQESAEELAADAAFAASEADFGEPPASSSPRKTEAAPVPAPASEPVPEAAPAEPPRRWQPPAPTVTPAATERKSGWWSKRS